MRWSRPLQVCPILRLIIFAGSFVLLLVLGTIADSTRKEIQRLDFASRFHGDSTNTKGKHSFLLRSKRNASPSATNDENPSESDLATHKLIDDKQSSLYNSGVNENFRDSSTAGIDSTVNVVTSNSSMKMSIKEEIWTSTSDATTPILSAKTRVKENNWTTVSTSTIPMITNLFPSVRENSSNETSTLLTKLITQSTLQENLSRVSNSVTSPQPKLRIDSAETTKASSKNSHVSTTITTTDSTSLETKYSDSFVTATSTVQQKLQRTLPAVGATPAGILEQQDSFADSDFTESSSQQPLENMTDSSNSVKNSYNNSVISSTMTTTELTSQWLANMSHWNVNSVVTSTRGPSVDHILPPLLPSSSADSIASQPTMESVGGVSSALGLGMTIGIIFGVIVVFILLAGFFGFLIYHKRLRSLSEIKYPTDNCGYVDDSLRVSYMNNHIELPKENPEEMFSLDNDSFLNSLEAMTLQNYWAEDAKNTKV